MVVRAFGRACVWSCVRACVHAYLPACVFAHASSHLHAGGSPNFVYAIGIDGVPRWTKAQSSALQPKERDWDRPEIELGATLFNTGKFADQVLRGGDNEDCDIKACNLPPNLTAAGWGYPDCCWTSAARVPDARSLQRFEELVLDEVLGC